MRVLPYIGRQIPRVCTGVGSFAPGKALEPGPCDEFSIVFRQMGDVGEGEFCESF